LGLSGINGHDPPPRVKDPYEPDRRRAGPPVRSESRGRVPRTRRCTVSPAADAPVDYRQVYAPACLCTPSGRMRTGVNLLTAPAWRGARAGLQAEAAQPVDLAAFALGGGSRAPGAAGHRHGELRRHHRGVVDVAAGRDRRAHPLLDVVGDLDDP